MIKLEKLGVNVNIFATITADDFLSEEKMILCF